MSNKNKLPLSARLYLKLRPLIIPFGFIEKYVPTNGTIVDIGCGFGIFANYLALKSKKRKVIGIDINKKRIEQANSIYGDLPNLNFICGNITEVKIPEADVITALDVLHHIPSSELQTNLLRSCSSVLRKNGKLIIKDVDTQPKWKYFWNYLHDFLMTRGEPVLYQDRKTIEELLHITGFKLDLIKEINGYPYAHILYISKKF